VRDASREVSLAEGVVCRTSRGSSGSPRFALAPVSMREAAKSRSSRSPEQSAQVHPLVLEVLFRVPSLHFSRPRIPFGSGPYCQGLVPLCGVTGCVHSSRGFPSPRYVPSAGAHNLSTAFSAPRLHGLVSSRSRIQGVSLVQGYPLRAAVGSSSDRPAPLPLFDGRSPGRILTATAGALGFEALFRAGARAREVGS